jgi:electron transfer flavoprotein beta subunit
MNILVFIKRVPDTESRIRIDRETKTVVEEGLNFIINPYDEYAIEEALRLRDAKGGKVVALRVARILAALAKARHADADLLLFGRMSVGADNAAVPTMVAEILGLPQVNVVAKLEIEGSSGTAHREIEGAMEKVIFSLPAVVSAQKGLNEPRYETLKGIMAAKKKAVPVVTPAELGLSAEDLAPRIDVLKIELPASKQAGKMIPGTPEEAARELVRLLRTEAKAL